METTNPDVQEKADEVIRKASSGANKVKYCCLLAGLILLAACVVCTAIVLVSLGVPID